MWIPRCGSRNCEDRTSSFSTCSSAERPDSTSSRARRPPLPSLVFITAHDRYAAEAFRVDAVDYLLKPVEPDALAEALHRVKSRSRSAVAGRTLIAHPAALQSLGLTAREAEVLFWIAHGKTNAEIAGILANSPETVKKQVQSLMSRLGVESRVSAALLASRVLGFPQA